MNLEAFDNKANTSQPETANATTQNDTSDRYKYLLSPKHLRIEVKSENTTQPKFSWYAKQITTTEIMIQLVFQDPLYISNDPKYLDSLVITILPPALKYFTSLASGLLTENPLGNFTRILPPQCVLGTAIQVVSSASDGMENLGKYGALANGSIQLGVSGSMAQMWSMVNALQIVTSFNYLKTSVPSNVLTVMTNLSNMLQLSIFPTSAIMSGVFNFTETQSPGAGFTRMGNDSKVLILFLGPLFFIGVLILAAYILNGFVHWFGKSNKICKKIDEWC